MIIDKEYGLPVERGSVIYKLIMGFVANDDQALNAHDTAVLALSAFVDVAQLDTRDQEVRQAIERWLNIANGIKAQGKFKNINVATGAIMSLEEAMS